MKFSELVKNISHTEQLFGDAEITSLEHDSRKVTKNSLFVAMKGITFDGHEYISKAIDDGAAAIICENLNWRQNLSSDKKNIAYALVADSSVAANEIASVFYNSPCDDLFLVGVTGTSGKTTVTSIASSMLTACGIVCGKIGTLGAYMGDKFIPTSNTTPLSITLQKLLRQMVDMGAAAVVIECSSHGLELGRIEGCHFDCGVFTNIARDHLDFHNTEEAYFAAKLKLFNNYLKRNSVALINADDGKSDEVSKATSGEVITFGIENDADFKAKNIKMTTSSAEFDLLYDDKTYLVKTKLGGLFNVYNALAAIAIVAGAAKVDIDKAIKALSHVEPASGRFEAIDCEDFGVIVDYAHTPDELENVLKAARALTEKRIISVFGCGGDRDKGKRPIMGKLSSDLADVTVVTSDNPRSEDPLAIANDIIAGIKDKTDIVFYPDRYEAIKYALSIAEKDDIVVVAGKGHEDYQIFADKTIYFDDREAVREILEEMRK